MPKQMLGMNPWVLLILIIILGITVLGYLDIKREIKEMKNVDLPALEHEALQKVFD